MNIVVNLHIIGKKNHATSKCIQPETDSTCEIFTKINATIIANIAGKSNNSTVPVKYTSQ